MKIPDRLLNNARQIIIFDKHGKALWTKTLSVKDLFDSRWKTWARTASKKRKQVKGEQGWWGAWATSVAAGNRTRRSPGLKFRKPGLPSEEHGYASRGWQQASSRMATSANGRHNRIARFAQQPWMQWAETVGTNAAKRNNRDDE